MTSESGHLKWDIPEDDGGSEITGYIVEKKDVTKNRSWSEVNSPTEELTFVVPKLLEGNQYLFRVSAQNMYGTSDPVELAEPVTAKNPYSKFSLG